MLGAVGAPVATAQPLILDPRLRAEVVATGLPTGIDNLVSAFTFVSPSTMLLGFRADGTIRRLDLIPGGIATPGAIVHDLDIITRTPTDTQSEFGIQGIRRHPGFATNNWLYLRYDHSLANGVDTPQASCTMFVTPMQSVVERWVWDPAANGGTGGLTLDALIRSSLVGNLAHHGGPPAFGPDGKLYIPFGDQRLSIELAMNSFPEVFYEAAHIARFNDDGSIPVDNPFGVVHGSPPGTEAWWAYGFRNIYGLVFDPATGNLWCTDNGENTYDEFQRVNKSTNGGHKQIAGPVNHPRQTGSIANIINIAGSPAATYKDPEFSWFQTCGVTGLLPLYGCALGAAFNDHIILGSYNTAFLWRFTLNQTREDLVLLHPGLQDRVDDRVPFNLNPTGTEAQELLLGRNIGSNFAGIIAMEMGMDGLPYILTADGRIIRLTRTCWADIVGIGGAPGADGLLTGDDFIAFINAFAAGDTLADVTGIGGQPPPDGLVTGDDFVYFINTFANGCP